MKSREYLREIRRGRGLSRAVLRKIVVEGRTVFFYLLTDTNYDEEDIVYAKTVSARYVPAGYRAEADVKKSVPQAEAVRSAIAESMKKYPSLSAFLSPADIEVTAGEGGGRFRVGIGEEDRARFEAANVTDFLVGELSRQFCGSWYGDFYTRERDRGGIEGEELPPEEIVFAPRVFSVENYRPIDGKRSETAVYIADLTRPRENIAVCGNIVHTEERMTKNNKPYLLISVTDGTGQIRGSYFTRKATLEKVRALKAGDGICMTGDLELYNGNLSFRAKYLDFGSPPEGFVPEARPSRPVPARYAKVIPEPVSNLVQETMYGGVGLPAAFTEGRFIVFDLETTGLNSSPAGGVMDRIIEIGAVKIERGVICEKFSSFVACPVRLEPKIIELTGIRDEMLLGAPEIGEVMADFYKFCDGAILVGHNSLQFDCNFIRYYGGKEGYRFDHMQYDTFPFAQRMLRLSNYKLNTIADHFGFTFRHHRAFDDAFVTAQIFTELVRMNGGLPK